jgi:hypothetical protein
LENGNWKIENAEGQEKRVRFGLSGTKRKTGRKYNAETQRALRRSREE